MPPPASRPTLSSLLAQSWHAFHPVPALYCVPGVLAALIGGLLAQEPGAAIVLASGAFSAGFGAFQKVSRLHVAPILLATFAMALAMAVGTVAANWVWVDALCVGLAAFTLGLGGAFGTGPWWVLLQGAIFIVVAGSQPGDLAEAMQRAGLVLIGGLVQAASVATLRRLAPRGFPRLVSPARVEAPATWDEWAAAVRGLFRRAAPEPRFGLLLGLAAAGAVAAEHRLGLANGYWVTMTVILVLRRGGGETVARGLLRIVGTLAGAGVATLLVAVLQPPAVGLLVLIAFSAWGAYALQWVNYGAFSVSVTSYIAFLFALQGAPEAQVAARRIEATLIGGALALAAFGLARLWRRAMERAGLVSAG